MIARAHVEPTPPSRSPSPSLTEQVIEDLVYEHLLDLIQLERLAQLEQVVADKLEELAASGPPDPGAASTRTDEDEAHDADGPAIIAVSHDAHARANRLIERAWHRVLADPRRYLDFRTTWQPDDECALCRALAESKT